MVNEANMDFGIPELPHSVVSSKLFGNQKEKLLDKQTQPFSSPNCDKSGQLDITQDVISVQACSSEDNKSLNFEQTYDRFG